MAKRKSAAEAAPGRPIAAPEAAPPPVAESQAAGPERRPFPDVTEQKQVLIAPAGGKLRLLRSSRFKQMQISGDGELPDWAKQRLHDAGWRDRTEEEGIWTKQLPPLPEPGRPEPSPSRRRMVFDAERLFEEIANRLRAGHEMPPVRLGGAEVAR